MPMPLSELSGTFDNAVVSAVAIPTSACYVTYATSLPIMSTSLFVSLAGTFR